MSTATRAKRIFERSDERPSRTAGEEDEMPANYVQAVALDILFAERYRRTSVSPQ